MADHGAAPTEPAAPKKKGKLLLIAVPLLLAGIGAGGWFSGIIPSLLGHKAAASAKVGAKQEQQAAAPPVYADIPEILSNLNVAGKRPSFVKMHAKLELGGKSDAAAVEAAMPRIQDMFQTYLRDMRPEELRGSEGSYRLREELISRANVAAAPAHVMDVLFVELVIE